MYCDIGMEIHGLLFNYQKKRDAMTKLYTDKLCRDQDSNQGSLGHNEKYSPLYYHVILCCTAYMFLYENCPTTEIIPLCLARKRFSNKLLWDTPLLSRNTCLKTMILLYYIVYIS